jgi:hypothetical protein
MAPAPEADDRAEGTAPEATGTDGDPVEHLWNAAHEMLRAFRTLIDAADEFVESQRGRTVRADSEPRPGRVQHITIDDDSDDRSSGAGVA